MKAVSQEITFKRITDPKSREFEQLWKIYLKCFPIRDERETKGHLLGFSNQHEHDGKYVESFLVSVNVNGKPAGGAVFDYVEGSICGRKICFAINWYTFIDKMHRHMGVGTSFHKFRLEMLQRKANERGFSGLDLLISEFNDPAQMKGRDAFEDANVMDEHERLEFFQNLGYRRIDFGYMQPQLTKNTKPYTGMMLGILPIKKALKNDIPAEYLKQLLWLYVWAGFAGIPGSDVKGRRNPDTDSAFLKMRNQLNVLGKSARLRLVPL